jgi:hypothetical protein
MNSRRFITGQVLFVLAGVALFASVRDGSIARADVEPIPQQDVLRLENRLTQLEQRLFSMDTTLRNLDQQSRLSGVSSRGVSQVELDQVRSQLQELERRLIEDECGLAKLDERTLTPLRREARRKSVATTGDQCRANFEAPLRLP